MPTTLYIQFFYILMKINRLGDESEAISYFVLSFLQPRVAIYNFANEMLSLIFLWKTYWVTFFLT